jgi:hypothetical protein
MIFVYLFRTASPRDVCFFMGDALEFRAGRYASYKAISVQPADSGYGAPAPDTNRMLVASWRIFAMPRIDEPTNVNGLLAL